MSNAKFAHGKFYLYFPLVILIFVVVSFGGKAVFDTANLPPLTPLHHIHAISMLAWFGLFALQPFLLARGQVKRHRALGRLSPFVVVLFLATAIPISLLNWDRIGEPVVITANLVNLILFIGFYISAIHWRRSVEIHKRLMVYASLVLVGPAAGRLPEIFDASPFLAAPIVLILILMPVVNDVVSRRRVHPASLFGFGLAFASIPVIVIGSESPKWVYFLQQTLG